MAYAFVVCVKINNEELFFNAFPFENSYIFIYGSATRGLSDFWKKNYVTLEVKCPVTR